MITLLTLKQIKLDKSLKHGTLTAGLTLSPADELSRVLGRKFPSSCSYSGECADVCIAFTGMLQMPTHLRARVERTRLWHEERPAFMSQLIRELDAAERRAHRKGLQFAVRLNVLSDIEALAARVAQQRPHFQLYDYTKIPLRYWDTSSLLSSYHRTYSFSERSTRDDITDCIDRAVNVAVVLTTPKGAPLPSTYTIHGHTLPVLDGDVHDLRFLDQGKRSKIVGLRFKGSRARKTRAEGTFIQIQQIQR